MPRGRPRKKRDVLVKSAELIGWAIGGIEREIGQTRERLAELTAQATKLRARAGLTRSSANTAAAGGGASAVSEASGNGRKRRRRKMSPEARKKISEMMKKRWAERKRGK